MYKNFSNLAEAFLNYFEVKVVTTDGQLEQARYLQIRLVELFDVMLYSADFPEGFRTAIELRGINMGPSRQPMSDTQKVDRAALSHVLQCILADFGYVDAPVEGCTVRTGDVDRDRIAQIAQGVMRQLRERGVL